jgi:hypothetical protein
MTTKSQDTFPINGIAAEVGTMSNLSDFAN